MIPSTFDKAMKFVRIYGSAVVLERSLTGGYMASTYIYRMAFFKTGFAADKEFYVRVHSTEFDDFLLEGDSLMLYKGPYNSIVGRIRSAHIYDCREDSQ